MSAENELRLCKLWNGQFAVVVRRCGQTVAETYGEVTRILAVRDTYDEIVAAFRAASDPEHPDYMWTEHGSPSYEHGFIPTAEELDRERAMLVLHVPGDGPVVEDFSDEEVDDTEDGAAPPVGDDDLYADFRRWDWDCDDEDPSACGGDFLV